MVDDKFVYFSIFVDDENKIKLVPIPDFKDCQRPYINACYVDVSYNSLIILLHYYDNSHTRKVRNL